MDKMSFNITGMSCSACSARIEKVLSKLSGISEVSVNLLTNSMSVTFDEANINIGQIVSKVEGLGYGASPKRADVNKNASPEKLTEDEASSLRKRLVISLIFAVPLFYISMGEMLGFPIPGFLSGMENSLIYAFTLFLLTIPILFTGRKYFINGFKNLFKLSPNMDSLIAIGSGAAVLYGIFAIYKIAWGYGHGDMAMVHKFSMDLYFESAGMILTLITLGKFFEARAKKKTSAAISKLIDLTPKTASVIRNGKEQVIEISEVYAGDILIVREGTAVPTDGFVLEGCASVDESAITGESLPVEKNAKDKITGGTVCKSGYIKMEATAVGENTALARIIRLVEEATSSKAPIAKLADKISGVFVPIVIGIALLTAAIWMLLGQNFEFAIQTSISVLVISCPCALGLATPTAIMAGTGKGAQNGILIKSAEALETLHSAQVVVLDKTGTVTEGKPAVTDIIAIGISEDDLLSIAASIEKMSGHPLAFPIVETAEKKSVPLKPVSEYLFIPGSGITGFIDGKRIHAGNARMMESHGISISAHVNAADGLAVDGKTVLYFSCDNMLIGLIAVADIIKPTSGGAVRELTSMGLEVIMLTGDNKRTAEAIRKEAGLTTVISEVLPEDKEREIRALQDKGKKVVMVGDGINDAPGLARADVGIAIGAGTDVAIESADIVLMKSDLNDVVNAINLSKSVMRNIKQNLFWAFVYNVVGIPVAAGVFFAAFGLLLNPMIAAAAMSFSSVSVVTNALRLNLWKTDKGKL